MKKSNPFELREHKRSRKPTRKLQSVVRRRPEKNSRELLVVFFKYPPVSRIVSVWCCAVGAAQRCSRSCGVAAGAQKLRQHKEGRKYSPGRRGKMWRVPALSHGWRKPRCGAKQHYLRPRPRELPLAGYTAEGQGSNRWCSRIWGRAKQDRATKVALQARDPP